MNEFNLTENSIQNFLNLQPCRKIQHISAKLQILNLVAVDEIMNLNLSDGKYYHDDFLIQRKKVTHARQYDFITIHSVLVDENKNKRLNFYVTKFDLEQNDIKSQKIGSPKKYELDVHEQVKTNTSNNFRQVNFNLEPMTNNNFHNVLPQKINKLDSKTATIQTVKINFPLQKNTNNQSKIKESHSKNENNILINLTENKENNELGYNNCLDDNKNSKEKFENSVLEKKLIQINQNVSNINSVILEENKNKSDNLISILDEQPNYNNSEELNNFSQENVLFKNENVELEILLKSKIQYHFNFSNYEEFQDNFSIKIRIFKYDIEERTCLKMWVIDRTGVVGTLIIPSDKINDYTDEFQLYKTYHLTKVLINNTEGTNCITLTDSSKVEESNLRISLCNKEETLSDYVTISQLPDLKNNFFKMLVYILEVERQKFNMENGVFVVSRKLIVTDESNSQLEILLTHDLAKKPYTKGDIVYLHLPVRQSSESGIRIENSIKTIVEINPPAEFVKNYKNKIIKQSGKFSFLGDIDSRNNQHYEEITSKGIKEQLKKYLTADPNKIFEFKCTVLRLELNSLTVYKGCPRPNCKYMFSRGNKIVNCQKCKVNVPKKQFKEYYGLGLICQDSEDVCEVFLPHDESVRILKFLDFNYTAEEYRIIAKERLKLKKKVINELKSKFEFIDVIFRGKIVSRNGKKLESLFHYEVTDFLPSFLDGAKNLYWHDKIKHLNDALSIN